MTLIGTNFTGATKVDFSGASATTYTVVSATQIIATVPTGATSGTVAVTTPAGTGTSSSSFTISTTTPKFWTLTVTHQNDWNIMWDVKVTRTDVIPNVGFAAKQPNVNSPKIWTDLPEGTYLLTCVYSGAPNGDAVG